MGVAEVTVRPLAALFKLADALHTDYRRVSLQVVEIDGKHASTIQDPLPALVTGWHFDSLGRIAIDAAPKDWDDVGVISVGFEKTRQELEPIIPTLKDAGFPMTDLRPDEADLERKGQEQVEAERRIEHAFVGMDYFTEEDTPRFKAAMTTRVRCGSE